MQNDVNQTINEMMSDERTDEANSEASDNLYMVDVDDSDSAYEVDISDAEDAAEKVGETSSSKDASAELLSCVGSAASSVPGSSHNANSRYVISLYAAYSLCDTYYTTIS